MASVSARCWQSRGCAMAKCAAMYVTIVKWSCSASSAWSSPECAIAYIMLAPANVVSHQAPPQDHVYSPPRFVGVSIGSRRSWIFVVVGCGPLLSCRRCGRLVHANFIGFGVLLTPEATPMKGCIGEGEARSQRQLALCGKLCSLLICGLRGCDHRPPLSKHGRAGGSWHVVRVLDYLHSLGQGGLRTCMQVAERVKIVLRH